jgi:hypothetical protein
MEERISGAYSTLLTISAGRGQGDDRKSMAIAQEIVGQSQPAPNAGVAQ